MYRAPHRLGVCLSLLLSSQSCTAELEKSLNHDVGDGMYWAEYGVESPAYHRLTAAGQLQISGDEHNAFASAVLFEHTAGSTVAYYALTAAHAVDYQTAAELSPGKLTFTLHFSAEAGQLWSLPVNVQSVISYGSSVGKTDLALLRLDRSVPVEMLQDGLPVLATAQPAQGAYAAMYGYGFAVCGQIWDDWKFRSFDAGEAHKSAGYFIWEGPLDNGEHRLSSTKIIGCPRDSGAPVVIDKQIVWLFSGTRYSEQEMFEVSSTNEFPTFFGPPATNIVMPEGSDFADVVQLRDTILEDTATLNAQLGTPVSLFEP